MNTLRVERALMLAVAVVLVAALPPVGTWLKASLTTHLMVQFPALIGAGAVIGARLRPGRGAGRDADRGADWLAGPALLLAAFVVTFWAIPRWIDAAVTSPGADLVKVVTLVLAAGVPLGWGWRRAGPILRGLAWTQAAGMLAVMGWLQVALPIRLCNAYLVTDQQRCGQLLIALAVAIVVAGVVGVLVGPRRVRPLTPPPATGGQHAT